MDTAPPATRGRGGRGGGGPGVHKNKVWTASSGGGADAARWERGGHHGGGGGGRARGTGKRHANRTLHNTGASAIAAWSASVADEGVEMSDDGGASGVEDAEDGEEGFAPIVEPEFKTPAELDKYWNELGEWRKADRQKAIDERRMDEPGKAINLSDAIDILGTCPDMCPRYERYDRLRGGPVDPLEYFPGTRTLDHNRAVKRYQRASGDRWQPSDIRPAIVCKRTLDYLFHKVLPTVGLKASHAFVRDRSRSVRNDLLIQPKFRRDIIASSHERCVRFHILSTHLLRDSIDPKSESEIVVGCFSKLRELYAGASEFDDTFPYPPEASAAELEMYIYWRLWTIREDTDLKINLARIPVPPHIASHTVYIAAERFRTAIKAASGVVTKSQTLSVDARALAAFKEMVGVLQAQMHAMVAYLVACTFEKEFGPEKVGDFEYLRGGMSVPYMIDGPGQNAHDPWAHLEPAAVQEAPKPRNALTDAPALPDEDATPPPPLPKSTSQPAVAAAAPPAFGGSTSAFPPSSSAPNGFGASALPLPGTRSAAPTPGAPSSASNPFGISNPASTAPNPFSKPASAFTTAGAPPSTSNSFGGANPTSSAPNPFGAPKNSPFSIAAKKDVAERPVSAFGQLAKPASAFGQTQSAFSSTSAPAPAPAPTPAPAPPPAKTSIFSKKLTADMFSGAQLAPPPELEDQAMASPTTPGVVPAFAATSAPTFGTTSTPAFGASSATAFGASPLNPQATPFAPTPSPFTAAPTPAPEPAPITPTQRPHLAPIATTAPPPTSTSIFPKPPPHNAAPGPVPTAPPTALPSPIAPSPSLTEPPAPKPGLMSLPPTPTVHSFEASRQPRPLSLFTSGSMSALGAADKEPLSPLNLGGPSFLSRASSFSGGHGAGPVGANKIAGNGNQSLSRRQSVADSPLKNAVAYPPEAAPAPTPTPVPAPAPVAPALGLSLGNVDKGKGKQKADASPEAEAARADVAEKDDNVEDINRADAHFARAPFRRWRARAEYARAVKRSAAYRPHARAEGGKRNATPSAHEDADSNADADMPDARRVRRRVSGRFVQPRTDEEIAARLQQNSARMRAQWEPGTFLRALRAHVHEQPADWALWLCVNEHEREDATATWLQTKFGVPGAGAWRDARVFGVPLNAAQRGAASPGLIVFECTPARGVDEIERRYRALDDFARFRDVLGSLPEERHFVPALLVVVWDSGVIPDDLNEEILGAVNAGVLGSYTTFALSVSTDDLDARFTHVLSCLTLDTAGGYVDKLSGAALLADLLAPAREHADDVAARFEAEGAGDAAVLAALMRSLVELVNDVGRFYLERYEDGAAESPLPAFNSGAKTMLALYDATDLWLNSPSLRTLTQEARADLAAARAAGEDLPLARFADVLFRLAATRASADAVTVTHRTRATFRAAVAAEVGVAAERARRAFSFAARPQPKRRSEDVEESSIVRAGKKARMSFTEDEVRANGDGLLHANGHANGNGNGNGHASPPPSLTPSPAPSTRSALPDERARPPVTHAMLRAMARDVLQGRRAA